MATAKSKMKVKRVYKKTVYDLFESFMYERKKVKGYTPYFLNTSVSNSQYIIVYNVDITEKNKDSFIKELNAYINDSNIGTKNSLMKWKHITLNKGLELESLNGLKLNTRYKLYIHPIKLPPTHYEDEFMRNVNCKLEDIKKSLSIDYVPIKYKNNIYFVKSIEKVPQNGRVLPKADLYFLDINDKPCLWISHKNGNSPTQFQQWGGVSDKAGKMISQHKEVLRFYNYILNSDYVNKETGEFKSGTKTLICKIEDPLLKKLAVYGKNYSSNGSLGLENIAYVIQGDIDFKKTQLYAQQVVDAKLPLYEVVSASNNKMLMHENGEDITGAYEPALMARYGGDRSFNKIKKCRAGIFPINGRVGIDITDKVKEFEKNK